MRFGQSLDFFYPFRGYTATALRIGFVASGMGQRRAFEHAAVGNIRLRKPIEAFE